MSSPPVSQYQSLEDGLRQASGTGGRDDQVAGLDRCGYLFGRKIANSLSPYLHGVIYKELGLKWAQIRVDSDDLQMFLKLIRQPQFYGKSQRIYMRLSRNCDL
jgi:hypothetical protein